MGENPRYNLQTLMDRYERGVATQEEINFIVWHLRARLAVQERVRQQHEAAIQRGEAERDQIALNISRLDQYWSANELGNSQVRNQNITCVE